MSRLSPDDCTYVLSVEPEHVPYVGNCSAVSPEQDAETESWIREQLAAGNEWAWCIVTVTAHYEGYSALAGLGCCSYESEASFRDDPYFSDLKAEAFNRLSDIVGSLVSPEPEHHYTYGSGMVGCLYYNGPHVAETEAEAIESLCDTFSDLPDQVLSEMREALAGGGAYYFDSREIEHHDFEGCKTTPRIIAGADYCEITRHDGPLPDDREDGPHDSIKAQIFGSPCSAEQAVEIALSTMDGCALDDEDDRERVLAAIMVALRAAKVCL